MESNLYLAPDNVNQLLHLIQQQIPGYQMDPKALVNYMQQVFQQFPNQHNLDARQYLENLNQYTVRSLAQYVQGQNQQAANQEYNNMSPDAQVLSTLVDQLKRERNYSEQPNHGMPPQQLNFMEPVTSQGNLVEQVKNKLQQEHQMNHNGQVRSVNLTDVMGRQQQQQMVNYNNGYNNGQNGYGGYGNNGWSTWQNQPPPPGTKASPVPNQPTAANAESSIPNPNSPNFSNPITSVPVNGGAGGAGGNMNMNMNMNGGFGGAITNGVPGPATMALRAGLAPGHERLLSLDFRTDVAEISNHKYTLRFPTIRGVIGLELVAVSLQRQKKLDQQPYLYLSMETNALTLNTRCQTGSQRKDFFGKLIPENETFNHYIKYQSEQGPVSFQNPVDIYELSLAFLDYQFENLDLKRVPVIQLVRMERNQVKIITEGPHYMNSGDYLLMTQRKEDAWVAYQSKVIETPDAETLITHCQSSVLHHLNIYRVRIHGHLTLRLRTMSPDA